MQRLLILIKAITLFFLFISSSTGADRATYIRMDHYGANMVKTGGEATWKSTFGGKKWDIGYRGKQTKDGGYIIAAHAGDTGKARVLRLDSKGKLTWDYIYLHGYAYNALETMDGGFVVVGRTYSEKSDVAFVLKLNSDGKLLWDKFFGARKAAYSVAETGDGEYVVAGAGALWIDKIDADGNLVWGKNFGGKNKETAQGILWSIEPTKDSGSIITGEVDQGKSKKALILKLDAQGNLEWERTYGGAHANWARSIKQTDDGGYVAAGTKWYKRTTRTDMWVIRLDNKGEIVWEQTSGGKGQNDAFAIDLAEDGGFVIAGSAYLKESGAVKIVKLDPKGEILWTRVYDTRGNDGAFDLRRTKDGGFIVTGETFVDDLNKIDVLVLKLDSEGLLIPHRGQGAATTIR